MLSYGTVDGHAEVEFLVKEEIYRAKWIIWRSRGKVDGKINTKRELAQWNGKKELFEIIGDKVRDITEKVEQITGLDYERFSKSVMLSQGDFAAFLNAGDRERSNLLERITGTAIYSHISIAAFKRHKEEEQKITALKTELERLQILDSATLKGIKKEKKDLLQESKTKQKEITGLQNQLQWRHKLEELTQQKSHFANGVTIAEQQLQAARPAFARLEKHQQTLVFQKEITQIEGLEKNQKDLLVDQTEGNQAIQKFQQSKDQLAQKVGVISEQLKTIKKEKASKEQLFEQVNALDVKLAEKQMPYQKIIQQNQQLVAQIAENQLDKEAAQKAEEEKKQLIQNIKDWQNRNENFKSVGSSIPALTNLFHDWETLKKEEQALTEESAAQQITLQEATSFLENYDSQLTAQKNTIASASKAFLNQFSTTQITDRGQLLENLNQELEQLDSQAKNLTMLIDLNKDYQALIKELTHYDEEIQDLENKRNLLESRLLSALEMEEEVQRHFDYKLQMFEREKLLANYDRERSNLQEGDKCPLCFSTTHPFRQIKDYKPYVNEAEVEYLAAKKQLDLVKIEARKLSLRHNEIGNQIQQIIGEQERNIDGKRDIILKNIKASERKIAIIAPELLDVNLFHIRKGDLLANKLMQTKNSLSHKRTQRSELIALNQHLLQQEKAITALQQEQHAQKLKLANAETNSKNTHKQLGTTQKKLTQLRKKIEQLLQPYQYSINELTPKEILQKLTKKQVDYERAVAKLNEEKEALVILNQTILQLEKQAKDLRQRQVALEKEIEQFQKEIGGLKKERITLFGEQSITIVRNQLTYQLETIEKNVDLTNQALKEAEIQLKSEVAKAKKVEKDLAKISESLIIQEAQLLTKIQSKGFESVALLKEANLPEAEVTQLETQKKSLEKTLTEGKQSLKNATQAFEETFALAMTTESLATILSKKGAIEEQQQVLQQQIGKLTQQIEDNDQRKEQGKTILKELDIQQKEYRRWAKLKELIGSADGKLFRAFAQGLTLKKLSQLANKHLRQLNGRYLIHKPNDKDLTLEIIDQHQANNIRSIHTLSGGESFLVSLALALGLSDLAGRNTQIKSLFIDEGFGTLDESALDLAISTLENLQSIGKRIGIISHVSALKERIATQIQVQKRGSGFSEILIA